MRILFTSLLVAALAGCAATGGVRSLDEAAVTDKGLVSGTGTAVRSFKGIPSAQAPVGNLRWRAPQPAAAWSGVPLGTRLGRPSEAVLEILPVDKIADFVKQDGERIVDSGERRSK